MPGGVFQNRTDVLFIDECESFFVLSKTCSSLCVEPVESVCAFLFEVYVVLET